MKGIFAEYEASSSQCINFDKSTVFFSTNTLTKTRLFVSGLLGMRNSNNVEKYLGLYNVMGRNKKASFQILKDRVKTKIDGWSTRSFSQGGKEVFIKSALQAIPTYSMMCFLLLKTLCSEVECIFARYWWQKWHGQRGIHWCSWDKVCGLKTYKGLGFRNLTKFNVALLAKQGWRLLNYLNSLLSCILKAKYYLSINFLHSSLGNLPSYT